MKTYQLKSLICFTLFVCASVSYYTMDIDLSEKQTVKTESLENNNNNQELTHIVSVSNP